MEKIYYILILFIALSCSTKEDDRNLPLCDTNCTTIQGRFLTENGKVPVTNLDLSLEWGITSELGGQIIQIADTKTAKDGSYLFSFYVKDKELKDGTFAISFKVKNDSFLTPIYPYFKFMIYKRDTVITHDYLLPKKSFINVYNSLSLTDNDYLLCDVMYLCGGGMIISYELDSRHENQKVIETAGNQYTYLRIIKNTGNQRYFYNDSIMVYLNDTSNYIIK